MRTHGSTTPRMPATERSGNKKSAQYILDHLDTDIARGLAAKFYVPYVKNHEITTQCFSAPNNYRMKGCNAAQICNPAWFNRQPRASIQARDATSIYFNSPSRDLLFNRNILARRGFCRHLCRFITQQRALRPNAKTLRTAHGYPAEPGRPGIFFVRDMVFPIYPLEEYDSLSYTSIVRKVY